ncbi:MAG: hypothetical protein V9H69_01005 [Anaerolineae bacterium]
MVPNKELMTRTVLALTYTDRMTRVRLDISVAYQSDMPQVEQRAAGHPAEPPPDRG